MSKKDEKRRGCKCGATLGKCHNVVVGSMGHKGDCPDWGKPPNQWEHRKIATELERLKKALNEC